MAKHTRNVPTPLKISLILCIGYGLRYNCLFIFLRSLRKLTQFYLGLGCANHGAPHYYYFALSRNPKITKNSTDFKIFLCVTLVRDMSSKISASNTLLTWIVMDLFSRFQVFYQNNCSNFCINVRNLLRCVSVRCWHWFFMTLFKSAFSYLASKITRNNLVEVRTFSNSCISSA